MRKCYHLQGNSLISLCLMTPVAVPLYGVYLVLRNYYNYDAGPGQWKLPVVTPIPAAVVVLDIVDGVTVAVVVVSVDSVDGVTVAVVVVVSVDRVNGVAVFVVSIDSVDGVAVAKAIVVVVAKVCGKKSQIIIWCIFIFTKKKLYTYIYVYIYRVRERQRVKEGQIDYHFR